MTPRILNNSQESEVSGMKAKGRRKYIYIYIFSLLGGDDRGSQSTTSAINNPHPPRADSKIVNDESTQPKSQVYPSKFVPPPTVTPSVWQKDEICVCFCFCHLEGKIAAGLVVTWQKSEGMAKMINNNNNKKRTRASDHMTERGGRLRPRYTTATWQLCIVYVI